jgi:hypothetical protein
LDFFQRLDGRTHPHTLLDSNRLAFVPASRGRTVTVLARMLLSPVPQADRTR